MKAKAVSYLAMLLISIVLGWAVRAAGNSESEILQKMHNATDVVVSEIVVSKERKKEISMIARDDKNWSQLINQTCIIKVNFHPLTSVRVKGAESIESEFYAIADAELCIQVKPNLKYIVFLLKAGEEFEDKPYDVRKVFPQYLIAGLVRIDSAEINNMLASLSVISSKQISEELRGYPSVAELSTRLESSNSLIRYEAAKKLSGASRIYGPPSSDEALKVSKLYLELRKSTRPIDQDASGEIMRFLVENPQPRVGTEIFVNTSSANPHFGEILEIAAYSNDPDVLSKVQAYKYDSNKSLQWGGYLAYLMGSTAGLGELRDAFIQTREPEKLRQLFRVVILKYGTSSPQIVEEFYCTKRANETPFLRDIYWWEAQRGNVLPSEEFLRLLASGKRPVDKSLTSDLSRKFSRSERAMAIDLRGDHHQSEGLRFLRYYYPQSFPVVWEHLKAEAAKDQYAAKRLEQFRKDLGIQD